MGLGIDLDIKNARNHTPLELTSNEEIKNLIKQTINTHRCLICNEYFTFFVKKFLCFINEEVICKHCCDSEYYFENEKSEVEEILECRCKNCSSKIKDEEVKLVTLISLEDLDSLQTQFENIITNNIKINPKLKVKAEWQIDRLQRIRKINNQICGLENVIDHKTIEKSVTMLLNELEYAKEKGIILPESLIERVVKQRNRKIAEKNLRRLLSNTTVFDSSEGLKTELEDKMKLARETGTDQCFLDQANSLLEKVCLNLNFLDVYQKLVTYPPREYKPKDLNDKKKKKIEPIKKKKKKEPVFPTPDWAKTSKDVKDKVDEYQKYLKMGLEIGLKDEFISKSKDIFSRFKLEIEHRRGEEEEQRLLEEEKLKKMKKKK